MFYQRADFHKTLWSFIELGRSTQKLWNYFLALTTT
jgi:hypothetical protein